MQRVKKLFTKAKERGGDPHLAMLCLRTTPIDHNMPSPYELLYGSRYKSTLPAISSRSDGDVNAIIQRQDVYKSFHDRTAKELAPLSPQQTVRELNPIPKTVGPGQCYKQSKHAEIVQHPDCTRNRVYRRNRRHLRDTQEEWKDQSSNDGTILKILGD